MNSRLLRAGAGVALALASGSVGAAGNVTGSFGVRAMDEDFWAPVEDQGVIGVLADISFGPAPVSFGLGVQLSADEGEALGIDVSSDVVELSAGLKYMPQTGLVRPFFGGGLVSTRVHYEGTSGNVTVSDDDRSGGYYVEGGVLFRVARSLGVGLNVRLVRGTEVELFGAQGDADATTITAIVGYGWGEPRRPRRRGRPAPEEHGDE